MITFWIFAVSFIIVGLAIILLPFYWNKQGFDKKTDQTELNIKIAKERLAELEVDLTEKRMDKDEYDEMKKELESALYFDLENQNRDEITEKKGAWGGIAIAIFVPLLSIFMYLSLGSKEGMKIVPGQKVAAMTERQEMGNITEMVKKLVDKLKKDPENIEGWTILAKTMMNLGQYKEAVMAFRRVLVLSDNDEMALVSLADAIAMSKGGDLTGEPLALLNKALTINKNNITALWLLGMEADDRGAHEEALTYWNKLYPMLKDTDEFKLSLASLINGAHKKLGKVSQLFETTQPVTVSKNEANETGAKLNLKVILSDHLKASVAGNELVFIYAKAMVGPPMPLAAKKISVAELPADITLDDSMAMMPQMKLSSFDQVIVGARISQSGQAIAQKGDLYGEVSDILVKQQKDTIVITINQVK